MGFQPDFCDLRLMRSVVRVGRSSVRAVRSGVRAGRSGVRAGRSSSGSSVRTSGLAVRASESSVRAFRERGRAFSGVFEYFMPPNQSPEPTGIAAVVSAQESSARRAAGCRWLSLFR